MSALDALIAFAAGAASFLSPCVLPIVPAYLALVAGADPAALRDAPPMRAAAKALPGALAFVLGFGAVFVALGMAAAAASAALATLRPTLEIFAGFALTLLGLHMLDWLRWPFLERALAFAPPADAADASAPRRLATAAVAGVAFGGAWSPCIGPVLAAILALAATTADPGQGAALLGAYALGLGAPFLLAAAGARAFLRVHARAASKTARWIEPVAGAALLITGLLVLTGLLTAFANFIFRVAPFLGALG